MTGPPRESRPGGAANLEKLQLDQHNAPQFCGTQTSCCEHANTRIEQLADGPHHAKEICTDCGQVLRWLPKPENVKRQELNAFRLIKLAMRPDLTHWERKFVASISHRPRLSPKQQQIIDRLCATYLEGKSQ